MRKKINKSAFWVIGVILIVLVIGFIITPNNTEDGKQKSVVKNENQIEDFEVPEKKVEQTSDKPVTIQTDGKPNVKEIAGYDEEGSMKEVISEERITIKSIGSYSGPYVEDGTNEEVKDILSIVVTNTSKEFLQYSEITMKNGDERATFALSNLPSGASALVLAKDRVASGGNWTYEDDVTAFIKKAELHEDKFSWEAGNNFLVLNNKSQDKHSKVHVYYKNTQDGIYIGGITYRIAFENLEVGEKREKLSKHFDGNNSHVMMIDYIDEENDEKE